MRERPLPLPQATLLQRRDHIALAASGMAANEHLAVRLADRKARLAVVMSRTTRHPAQASFTATERPDDGLSGHGAPLSSSGVDPLVLSFAGTGSSARDHSARMEKKPVTLAADLFCLVTTQVAPDARLPDLTGSFDLVAIQVVVCSFHRRSHGRIFAAPRL